MWTAIAAAGSPGYGLGFGVRTDAQGRVVGHTGGFPGISASFETWPERGYTVAVLANLDGAAMPVAEAARELIGRIR